MPPLTESAKEQIAGMRVVALQVMATIIITVLAYLYSKSLNIAAANLWGGVTAVLNGVLLVRGLSLAEKRNSYQLHHLLRSMYRSSIERFLVVIVFLATGMGIIKFPAAILCGFVVSQVALIVARILMIKR